MILPFACVTLHIMTVERNVSKVFLPPFSGLELDDWSDTGVLAQVLAASQQEYLDSLKKKSSGSSSSGSASGSNNESTQEWTGGHIQLEHNNLY